MAGKPVTGLVGFGGSAGPLNSGNLDVNYNAIAAVLNELATYGNFLQDTSGAPNTLVTATAAGLTVTLQAGLRVEVKVANTNTGATTLAINAIPAANVVNPDGSALGPGALQAGGLYALEFDGVNFQVLGNQFSTTLPANTQMSNGPPAVFGFQLGTSGSPSTVTNPVMHVAKYFTGSGSANYEGGAAWFSTYHEGGTQPSVGLTGFARLDAGAAAIVGLHGRADNEGVAGANVFAGWSTATDTSVARTSSIVSHEMDITIFASGVHSLTSPGATDPSGVLVVNTSGQAAGAFHGTRGLGIYSWPGAMESSWFTALQIGGNNQNVCPPGNANEAIQLNGGTLAANAFAAFRTAGFLGGTVGAGTSAAFDLAGKLTGAVTTYGTKMTYTYQSDVTTEGGGYVTSLSTQAAAFTMANLRHFEANQGSFGAGSTVTNQVGFYAATSLSGAGTNYGFLSALNVASDWAFFASGIAPSFFGGGIRVPGASAPLITATTTITNGAGAGAGTLTNAPSAGNPTKWFPINDNGTTRFVPAW